jgi:hypothetical protein
MVQEFLVVWMFLFNLGLLTVWKSGIDLGGFVYVNILVRFRTCGRSSVLISRSMKVKSFPLSFPRFVPIIISVVKLPFHC